MQIKASKTKSETPKKYSRPSSKGHREYKVQMTFLVSFSIKLKIQTCPRRHLRENEIKKKTPQKYSRPSSKGHREYMVLMTFLVSVSIKLKI